MTVRDADDPLGEWLDRVARCEDGARIDLLARVRAKRATVLPYLDVPAAEFGMTVPLEELEPRLDSIMERLGVPYDPEAALPQTARDALVDGRDVDAVYAYRRATGARLIESLRVVRSLRRLVDRGETGIVPTMNSAAKSAITTKPATKPSWEAGGAIVQ